MEYSDLFISIYPFLWLAALAFLVDAQEAIDSAEKITNANTASPLSNLNRLMAFVFRFSCPVAETGFIYT